jgi:signal transduction histidine kinase/CheY-like chemotaxis protein
MAELLQDITIPAVVVPWLLGVLLHAGRHDIPGSRWLFAAMTVAALGALHENLISHGLLGGPRLLYPALCLFLVLGSLALARQDRALSDRHRRLVTHSEDAMLEVTADGSVRQLNPAAKAFLQGLELGGRFLEMVPEASRPLVAAHLSRAGVAPTRCEFALVDGRVVESVATPVDAEARLLVLRDVSRRRRAEDDLLTAARVETAGLLVGGIAHDFNNLLAALLGHVGLLRMQLGDDGPLERLDRMEGVIERASGITRRLLAVGGRSHASPSHVQVHVLLTEVVEMAEPVLPVDIHLVLRVDDGLPAVFVSSEDLRHVVLNLVLNARDAIGRKGTIELRASLDGEQVCIEVIDSGPGVPPELLERIWDPFFTTKGPDSGTGLGLPMARRLVRQAGGQIRYVPGQGGCFRITFPSAELGEDPITHHDGARVAVVDDEEALRTAFAEALRRAGYEVAAYPDAATALPALVTEPPDVLVTDVVMPGMSGLELATALRELQPDLPVVVVSGFVPAREQLLRDGLSEHLDKPLRPEQVVAAVGRLMGRSVEGLPARLID